MLGYWRKPVTGSSVLEIRLYGFEGSEHTLSVLREMIVESTKPKHGAVDDDKVGDEALTKASEFRLVGCM